MNNSTALSPSPTPQSLWFRLGIILPLVLLTNLWHSQAQSYEFCQTYSHSLSRTGCTAYGCKEYVLQNDEALACGSYECRPESIGLFEALGCTAFGCQVYTLTPTQELGCTPQGCQAYEVAEADELVCNYNGCSSFKSDKGKKWGCTSYGCAQYQVSPKEELVCVVHPQVWSWVSYRKDSPIYKKIYKKTY